MEEKKIVVINRFLNIEGKINALAEIVPTIAVTESDLSGEMLKFYHQLLLQPTESDNAAQGEMEI